MSAFIKQISLFLSIFLLLIILGIILPQTPRASSAHLFSQRDKDLLLRVAPSPRLIFIGGSNTSMSLNSQVFYDSLKLYPVNTGLSASIGLLYMLDNALHYIKPGDVIIVCPEYSQFYENLSIGTEDLLRVVIDKSPPEIFRLRLAQLGNSLKYVPKYALSKFKPTEYFFYENPQQVYLRSSFNKFGDMQKHWSLKGSKFATLPPLNSSLYDKNVIMYLQQFKQASEQKGAHVFITFPALHEKSFDQDSIEINQIQKRIIDEGFAVLGSPKRYRMPDSLMFDTPYHLIKPGIAFRTQLLLEDVKKSLLDNQIQASHD